MTKNQEMKKSKGSSVALSSYATPTSSSSQRAAATITTSAGVTTTTATSNSSSKATTTPNSNKSRSTTSGSKIPSPQSQQQQHFSLQDLSEDEKLKVSRLVEKLIELGNKHEETLQQLYRERQEHDQAMNSLQLHLEGQLSIIEDNMKLKDSKIVSLETKENMMSAMLVLYQSKLRNIHDIYLLTKHQDSETNQQVQHLQEELKHFQQVVQTQKQMIDNFEETKRQLELSYQLTVIKPLQEKVNVMEQSLEEEKKKRIEYEQQMIQYRTKNSLLEHEVMTMQTQLQTALTMTTKSTALPPAILNSEAVSAALASINQSNSGSSSNSVSSSYSGNGLLVNGSGTATATATETITEPRRIRETLPMNNNANPNSLAMSGVNTLPPPPTVESAQPSRNIALPSPKPTVYTGQTSSSTNAMVSGGTQTNDGHYDDYSVMYNSSVDSSLINIHTLSVHDPKDDPLRERRFLATVELNDDDDDDDGEKDADDSLIPTASDSPIRKKKAFKLGGLLKAPSQSQQQDNVNSSDEFASRPWSKTVVNNEQGSKKTSSSPSSGMVATLRRKPMRIPTASSFVMSSQEGEVNQSIESIESASSPPLEYSPITPGTVFKHLQQPKSSGGQQAGLTNSLRNSQASAISTDDPNSIYSSMYGDSEETTMSTIDNSLDLNNSSLDILYPLSNHDKARTSSSNGGTNDAVLRSSVTSSRSGTNNTITTPAVDLNVYLEMPSAIEPVKVMNQTTTNSKTKGIAVMDTPSPTPQKQSYSLLAQLKPNNGNSSIVRRSTSAPPAQRRRDSGTSAGDDELDDDTNGSDKNDNKVSTNGITTATAKKGKKSNSIFDLFDGKHSLKQQQPQSTTIKKSSTVTTTSSSHTTPTSNTRQPKSISFDDNVVSHSIGHTKSHHNSSHSKKLNPSPPQSSTSSNSKQNGALSPTTATIKVNIPTVNTIRKDTHRKETTLNPKKSPSSTTSTNGNSTSSKKPSSVGNKRNVIEHEGNLYNDSLFDLLEDLD